VGHIAEAAEIIRAGGLVCFPTRCLYGLGADALDGGAVERVFEAKQRPAGMPILVLISRPAQLEALAEEVPAVAKELMNRFWPGRLTFVFRASPGLPARLTAGTGKIGVRLAGHPVARALAEAVGRPITGTSANISGSPGCAQISELDPRLRRQVDLILDGGPLKGGIGSTVLDLTGDLPVVIREGEVSRPEILAVIRSL
jgi:L-threonylcarbamoyladenylate synthase